MRNIYKLSLATACAVAALSSQAAVINLADGGSTVTIDSSGSGLNSWVVGGQDHVFELNYFVRFNDTSAALALTSFASTFVQNSGNSATVSYDTANWRIDVSYTLLGSAFVADLAQQVRVTNKTQSDLTLRLFDYNEFDMAGTFSNDFGVRLGNATIRQSEGGASAATNVVGGATPVPDFSEIGTFSGLRTRITTNGYNLDTANGAGIGQTLGPADLGFAFQWNASIAAGQTALFSTDKIVNNPIPEPATMVGLGLGIASLVAARRKRNA